MEIISVLFAPTKIYLFLLKLSKLSQLLLYKHERIPSIGFTHVRKVAA